MQTVALLGADVMISEHIANLNGSGCVGRAGGFSPELVISLVQRLDRSVGVMENENTESLGVPYSMLSISKLSHVKS
jgi:hypothetical protein